MNYKIQIKKRQTYLVLKIAGSVTSSCIHVLSKKFDSLYKTRYETIVVDLSETIYIDSHGLGIFIYAWKMMEKINKSLVFLNPREFIRNIFLGTNLDRVLRVVDTVEEL